VHRLILLVFGLNTVFFGMCTMAHAQTDVAPMGSSMVCHAMMAQVPSAGGCNEGREQSAYNLEGQCAGGSCFTVSTAGERVMPSSDPGLLSVSSLPPQMGQPMLLADEFHILGQFELGRAPPVRFSDVVLRL
jgi:hypothetical protein